MVKNPRSRNGRDLQRRNPKRAPYDRVLIVCEGTKTEVNYFEEIRREARLSAVHVHVIPTPLGTEPQQIIQGAEKEFLKLKAFEKVYAVFDRDEHLTYANAIAMAEARHGKLKNDEKKVISFEVIASVPCFELWLLLHFADIVAVLDRHEAFKQLKSHLTNYDKGKDGTYAATVNKLQIATQRAIRLKRKFGRLPGTEAYTDVHELVDALRNLTNL